MSDKFELNRLKIPNTGQRGHSRGQRRGHFGSICSNQIVIGRNSVAPGPDAIECKLMQLTVFQHLIHYSAPHPPTK